MYNLQNNWTEYFKERKRKPKKDGDKRNLNKNPYQ